MVASALSLLQEGFARPWLLALLVTLPLPWAAWIAFGRRRRRSASLFLGGQAQEIGHESRLSFLFWQIALVFLIVAAAGPRWGREPNAPAAVGRDLMIVLDVSRSMLAENPPRSRLARAKDYLFELIDRLQHRGGHRVGLVVFAGQAKLACPLTGDFDHLRNAIEAAHPDRLGPAARLGGGDAGTRMAGGIELAIKNLDPEAQGFADILLVSDGDELAGDWQSAVDSARMKKVPVHAFAVGDPDKASRIPDGNGYLRFQGEYVTTRRRDDLLQTIAGSTGGDFLGEAGDRQLLVGWFQNAIAPLPPREWSNDPRDIAKDRSEIFFAVALAMLVLRMFLQRGASSV